MTNCYQFIGGIQKKILSLKKTVQNVEDRKHYQLRNKYSHCNFPVKDLAIRFRMSSSNISCILTT